jgi:demethylsterigmatocystin 6-O-methyltransferase
MYAQRSSVKDCFSVLALDEGADQWPAEQPFFVDVGGGTGQQCVALKKRWAEVKGRVVLQDLPGVVGGMKLPEGIEVMAYDFFTKQPITGKTLPRHVRHSADARQVQSTTISGLSCMTIPMLSVSRS